MSIIVRLFRYKFNETIMTKMQTYSEPEDLSETELSLTFEKLTLATSSPVGP